MEPTLSPKPLRQQNEPADLAARAVSLAADLLGQAGRGQSLGESRQNRKMARMMEDPHGKAFTIALADQVLRISSPRRAARCFRLLLQRHGCPNYFSAWERILMHTALWASHLFPGLVMPAVNRQVRRESQQVILSIPGEETRHLDLEAHLERDARTIVNLLGEAVLGEEEAQRRLEATLSALADPSIRQVSVKISSIFSQIHLPDYERSLRTIEQRLRALYRTAITTGSAEPKFVNLDMEEYRDLHLTVDAFRSVLDQEEFEELEAGIVLQAYLPDSYEVQKELTQWAVDRHRRTGAGIKIRLVKGANLAMERVEASLSGWPQAPYESKGEVDANFKRMLHFACQPENLAAVKIGVASHNLFDIAYAALLREEHDAGPRLEFEMLKGMANAHARTVEDRCGSLLLYTPVVETAQFENAISYLVRRLDENTAPKNFLCHLFAMEEGSPAWIDQRDRFLQACEDASSAKLATGPRRRQNRLTEHRQMEPAGARFDNEPDTDFSLLANRQWSEAIFRRGDAEDPLPRMTPVEDDAKIDEALRTAVEAQSGWEARGVSGRSEVLRRCAAVIARQRGEIIHTMMLEASKAIGEADTEVSEAVDFANYYARAFDHDEAWFDGTRARALGVVVVTPPWNFPYAIPAGGCLAALMAGNAVILKPAPETPHLSRLLAEHLWTAGVPREILQFLPLPDNQLGQQLLTDERVAAVILTGAMDTARRFRGWKPDLRLFAETSGKNSLVITAAADLDLAIKDLVRGAFGHAGQKCSATSLALVESEVYHNPHFLRRLKDATESLHVGLATDPASAVTPLIRPPSPELHRALTTLDAGESWLLEPRSCDEAGTLWSPGIKMGVRRDSWFHRTECFGPVLGLIEVRDLEEALAIQNATAYGLTGGIHSLDHEEIAHWMDAVDVGNAYINRSTTGAIVQRQPFGGWKDSVVGPGAKAGGPNYVANFCHWHENRSPQLQSNLEVDVADLLQVAETAESQALLEASARSYSYWWKREFSQAHEPIPLLGESNHFRYRPRPSVIIRVAPDAPLHALLQAILACRIATVSFTVSLSPQWTPGKFTLEAISLNATRESDAEFTARLAGLSWPSVRHLGTPAPALWEGAAATNATLISEPVLANGRLELRHYFREQSISQTTHRYGNVKKDLA